MFATRETTSSTTRPRSLSEGEIGSVPEFLVPRSRDDKLATQYYETALLELETKHARDLEQAHRLRDELEEKYQATLEAQARQHGTRPAATMAERVDDGRCEGELERLQQKIETQEIVIAELAQTVARLRRAGEAAAGKLAEAFGSQ
ncbi:hypothetical protein Micbo1qcDRAFT_208848 [Microdochium bolleyi]|uniref:Uncharacterized protein n=1 Tax=Microdochium bolleyi TaxID=196109 RepID=A0A136IP92_9PEZI|nr:hypothetical protein Micbo1qcDRAFT_208848 [Microdochium bolleyi]